MSINPAPGFLFLRGSVSYLEKVPEWRFRPPKGAAISAKISIRALLAYLFHIVPACLRGP